MRSTNASEVAGSGSRVTGSKRKKKSENARRLVCSSVMQDYRQLRVWQQGHEITLAIYRVTTCWPREEMYGLISQVRRASASIPTNLAEGCGREGRKELAHFAQIAFASACETEYLLMLARDLGYTMPADDLLQRQTAALKASLLGFVRTLRGRGRKRDADDSDESNP